MAFNKDDVIAAAQKYGPKQKGKVSIFVSQNRTSIDASGKEVIDTKKPSLFGYMTDNDMNMFSISLWKNKDAKKDRDGNTMKDKGGNTIYKITFKGNAESLGIKQNVIEIKPSGQEKDSLEDDIFS
jgi:hypothetical protein|tara:strand:- start:1417 stop:1794 length:378 start_codon:yes stop_codon:yes gene_type:complete